MRKPPGVQPQRGVIKTKKNIPQHGDASTDLRGASVNDDGISSGCACHVKYLLQNHVGGHEASASIQGAIPSARIRGFSRRRPVFDNGFQGITPFLTHLYLTFRHGLSAFPQNHRLHVRNPGYGSKTLPWTTVKCQQKFGISGNSPGVLRPPGSRPYERPVSAQQKPHENNRFCLYP